MTALLLFLVNLLASVGAPLQVSAQGSIVVTHDVAPAPPGNWIVVEKDDAVQISNGF